MADPVFAYISDGRLFVWDDGEAREIESTFAEQYQSRVHALKRKQAWKQEGSGARFMRGGVPLWGDDQLESIPVSFTGVAPGPKPNTILYTLSTGVVGGVFLHDLETGEERRLFHSADHRVERIATCADHSVIACTLRKRTGASVVAVMSPDGSELSEVTDGDVIDLAPTWVPVAAIREEGRRHQLVFQSAGIGRDAQGVFVAVGPSRALMLDAEFGEMQVLMESEEQDYLAPACDAQRRMYFIRRPYRDGDPTSPLTVVADAVLFPFRLLAAIFSWLSFFTMRQTGKPLLTSGSARRRSADVRRMMMMGNLAAAGEEAEREADKALRKAIRNWTLIRRAESGEEEVLARRVHGYSLVPSGGILLSDGFSISFRDENGSTRHLCDVKRLAEICAIPCRRPGRGRAFLAVDSTSGLA